MSDLCKHDLAEQDTYVADGYCPLCLLQRNVDLAREIERLQAELDAFKEAVPQKEVERLRAELEKACDIVEIHDDAVRVFKEESEQAQKDCNANAKRNGELLDKNAQLREALEKTRRANHHFEIAEKNWTDENARLREALEKAQGELINLQPHIPQACKPGHESFIDTYVDKALLVIEEALKEKLT